ncbi:hypothetical protein SAMN05444678_102270 [Sphingomonas sp. YR710]|uniref:hypothetical protein n=1 Tax=Sphingomonas sp. YR710 TaxID=1882773 RepID=UPI00089211B3|nr:hypothetical protein [Sphingomonas sp. YR710]SDC31152.1 hypothetical protein SAMN05444678_102270 [Sphingomonas sp. YR710]
MLNTPDATAQTALAAQTSRVAYFGLLDFAGDPLRLSTTDYPVTFSGTGDDDLDGHMFDALGGAWMDVSPVQHKEGGGSQVTVTLSGLIGVDTDALNQIGSRAYFQGRICRLWAMMRDPATDAPIGNIWSYYTGYMQVPKLSGDDTYQTITMTIESWLAFATTASGRTWLAQPRYDPDDHSAELSIAIANGTTQGNLAGSSGSAGAIVPAYGRRVDIP